MCTSGQGKNKNGIVAFLLSNKIIPGREIQVAVFEIDPETQFWLHTLNLSIWY
jgi:hypothetical protein